MGCSPAVGVVSTHARLPPTALKPRFGPREIGCLTACGTLSLSAGIDEDVMDNYTMDRYIAIAAWVVTSQLTGVERDHSLSVKRVRACPSTFHLPDDASAHIASPK